VPNPVSDDEAALLRIAQRETTPEYAAEFEPITRGFLFAVFSLGALGVMAVPYVLWRALVRAFSSSQANGI
jgi:hypothetical protein